MTHHPHVHMIVPGGGLSLDGERWIACRPGFFLPVRVLSRLFRRLFLEKLLAAHDAGRLQFFGDHARLADAQAFAAYLAPLRRSRLGRLRQAPVRRTRGGARLSVALHPPRRHLQQPADRVPTTRASPSAGKDYRAEGRDRYKTMTLATAEFIRRFLIHVLPHGFHRIRHYGLFASGGACRQHRAGARAARRAEAVPSNPSRRRHRSTNRRRSRIPAPAAAAA